MGKGTCWEDEPDQQPSSVREPFASELTRLKQQGCCVLVTGSVSERVRAMQSDNLFGVADERRQRVLILTDATSGGTAQYLPDGITPEHPHVTVLDYTDDARNMAGVTDLSSLSPSMDSSSVSPESDRGDELVTPLYEAITDTIQTDQLSAGELRVGVATLTPLITVDGLSAACTFVRAVRTEMLAAHGIAHVHLPGSPNANILTTFRSIVDIHLELRNSQQFVPEHRWQLLDADLTTTWLSV